MMMIWWSKHVGVILSVLMCDIWIKVLLQTSALVGPLYIVLGIVGSNPAVETFSGLFPFLSLSLSLFHSRAFTGSSLGKRVSQGLQLMPDKTPFNNRSENTEALLV
jgi:hypothetical protein